MNKTIIGLDTETTGVNVVKDRIIQLSLIKFSFPDFEIIEKKKTLINPLIPINPGATKVHGIMDEMVATSITFKQFGLALLKYLDNCDYILMHNGKRFDRSILHEEFSRCGLNWIPKPIIDTYVIMSNRIPRTLSGAYSFYTGKVLEDAHDAENDVVATIEIFQAMYSQNEGSDLELESKYENEDKRLSWDGKIILNDKSEAVWGFGKWEGCKLRDADLGYINWFLSSDFPLQTKNILKSYL